MAADGRLAIDELKRPQKTPLSPYPKPLQIDQNPQNEANFSKTKPSDNLSHLPV
jgi:hypothetical protein